jgi:hypothetical protein
MNRFRLFTILCAIGCLGSGCSSAHLTLQYRTARDAVAPSKFVAVMADGMTPGLSLEWDLPPARSETARAAQQQAKEQFLGLIDSLEARQINGVEFECSGELKGFAVRVKSVPQLTEKGKAQIKAR